MEFNATEFNTLYGTSTNRTPCGYCRHHSCYLTVKQMKGHECLKKQCNYLVKNPEHDVWRQREQVKQKRKERKSTLRLNAGGSLV